MPKTKRAKSKARPKAKAKPKTKAKPKPKARPKAKPKTKARPKLKAKAGAKPKKFKRRPLPPPPKGVKEPLVPVLPPERAAPAAGKHPAPGESKPALRGAEIEEIGQMLLRRREELLAELRTGLAAPQGAARPRSADPTDQASDAADGHLNMALAQTESDELAQVEAALARIEANDFGICEECGQSIPSERLKTLPYATTCIDCKRRQEESKGQEGLDNAWEALDESEDEAAAEEET